MYYYSHHHQPELFCPEHEPAFLHWFLSCLALFLLLLLLLHLDFTKFYYSKEADAESCWTWHIIILFIIQKKYSMLVAQTVLSHAHQSSSNKQNLANILWREMRLSSDWMASFFANIVNVFSRWHNKGSMGGCHRIHAIALCQRLCEFHHHSVCQVLVDGL